MHTRGRYSIAYEIVRQAGLAAFAIEQVMAIGGRMPAPSARSMRRHWLRSMWAARVLGDAHQLPRIAGAYAAASALRR